MSPPVGSSIPQKANAAPLPHPDTVEHATTLQITADTAEPGTHHREAAAISLSTPSGSIATPHLSPVQQVAQSVIQVVQKGKNGPVELTLRPDELGQVRFEITPSGDRVHITLFVERPDAMDLIRRHADQLLNDLRLSGFSHPSLSFSEWSQRDSRSGPAFGQTNAADTTARQDGARPVITPTQNAAAAGRLDLRL